MNADNTFQTVTDDLLIELIDNAKTRLVFIAPGVRVRVAQALADAAQRLSGAVNVILDVDADVCRLGYGDLDGLKCLQSLPGLNGNILHAQPGVRIGVVISDDDTLFYSPTPLLIEAEPTVDRKTVAVSIWPNGEKKRFADKPNGVMIRKSVPPALVGACSADGNYSKREIGVDPVDKKDVEKAEDSLKKMPPKKFDLARQERVFSSKLCFMELTIRDYQIATKTVPLMSELFVSDADTKRRLTNRFKVFDKDRLPKDIKYGEGDKEISLSMDSIERQISDLRADYLINVGKWGTIILRSRLEEFKKKTDEIVKMLNHYKKEILNRVTELAMESCRKLANEVSPKLLSKPPAILANQLALAASDEDKKKTVMDFISTSCKNEIAVALKAFDPKMKMVEKDITYSTFSDPEFIKLLERPAPHGLGPDCIKKIFEEHDSARESN